MRRAIVVLASLPLLLVACGSGGGSGSATPSEGSPVQAVKQAAKKTQRAESHHIEMNATVNLMDQRVAVTGSGDFDTAARAGAMTVHTNLAGIDMKIEEVLSGTTVYMQSPLFSAALPRGKTWMKVDMQKLGAANGVDLGALLAQDPSKTFSQLQATSRVTKVDEEDGLTHYRGHIDRKALPGPYDVWVGDDGYVRRLKLAYAKAGQKLALTMNFSEFGKDVDVTVPAAAETVDATNQTLEGLGG